MADTWRRAPMQALARLHTLAAVDAVETEALVGPAQTLAFRPVGGVCGNGDQAEAPGVVVAGVVHGELLGMRPFGWGDDLIAPAALRLVLVARGVDPDALTVPEEGLLELGRHRFEKSFAAYQSGTPDGVSEWLIYNAAAVQHGATIARRLCIT